MSSIKEGDDGLDFYDHEHEPVVVKHTINNLGLKTETSIANTPVGMAFCK